jgi:neopullulanase
VASGPQFFNRLVFITFVGLPLIKIYMRSILKKILFISFVILSLQALPQVSVQRIDPPSWWTGMEEKALQLMIYGNQVAESNVIVDYPGVMLKKTTRLSNPNYLVLDLEITGVARPGRMTLLFEYQREILFTIDYELKERNSGSMERTGFGKKDVIYLIMPDRFSNGDTGNDSVPEMLEAANRSNPDGRHGGDLKGIRDRLDYISSLGATAIWLNPVQENNMPEKSYHGYAITDFYKVDPRLGDNESYKALVNECHDKGLKVIMDMVFNHCGGNHFWINDPPEPDWVHQFPEFTRSNFRIETAIDPYASEFDLDRMQTGWFDRTMPDLNQQHDILGNYLIQNSIWWVEFAGLDGIRMDTYPYSYKDFMAKWMQRLMREYPNFTVVGETWLQKESHTAYWQDNSPIGDKNNDSNLRSITDFPLHYALKDAFTEQEGWTSGLNRIYYVLAQDMLYSDPFCNVIFADNHDLTRFFTSIGEDYNIYRMAIAVLLTTRGIPMIYYGTELLMTGEEHKGHGFIREDFPLGEWDISVGGRRSAVGGQQEEALEYMRTILNWRKDAAVIHDGKLKQFVPSDGIYVYFRYTEKEAVMVIINKNKEDKTLDLARFGEVLKDYGKGRDVVSGKEFILGTGIILPAETALVLELDD